MEKTHFLWVDYVVCVLSMVISLLIGIYSAWRERKTTSMEGYVLGNRKMNPFFIGISVLASNVHATLIILGPLEVYMFGVLQVFMYFGQLICFLLVAVFYLPALHSLQLTSAYQVRKNALSYW